MTNQACPICSSKNRREIDSEIIYFLDQKATEPQMLRGLAEFCATRGITMMLTPELLQTHLRKHALVGVVGANDIRGGNIIQLPSGERIDVSDTKSVLRQVLIMGLANLLQHPEEISIKDTLRVADLLMRPDPNAKDTSERDELFGILLSKLKAAPPAQIDTTQNPYAAPSNVGFKKDE